MSNGSAGRRVAAALSQSAEKGGESLVETARGSQVRRHRGSTLRLTTFLPHCDVIVQGQERSLRLLE